MEIYLYTDTFKRQIVWRFFVFCFCFCFFFLVIAKDFSHNLLYCAFIVSIKPVGQVLTLFSKGETEPR